MLVPDLILDSLPEIIRLPGTIKNKRMRLYWAKAPNLEFYKPTFGSTKMKLSGVKLYQDHDFSGVYLSDHQIATLRSILDKVRWATGKYRTVYQSPRPIMMTIIGQKDKIWELGVPQLKLDVPQDLILEVKWTINRLEYHFIDFI